MAVAFRSGSSLAYGSRTNSTVTAPTGIQNDDVLVAVIAIGATTEAPDPTAPTGFSAVPGATTVDVTDASSFNLEFRAYYKVAASESGNYTFTHSAGNSAAWIGCYSGASAIAPISPNATSNSDVTGSLTTFLGVTTTVNGSMIIAAAFDWAITANDLTAPSGTTPTFTERLDATLLYVADGVMTTAGATGDKTMTNNGGNTFPWGAFLIPLVTSTSTAFTKTGSGVIGP